MKDQILDLLDKVDRATDEAARSLRASPRLALHEFASKLVDCPFYTCLGAAQTAPPGEASDEILDDLHYGLALLRLVHATSSADCILNDGNIKRILKAEIESLRDWSAALRREIARVWRDAPDFT